MKKGLISLPTKLILGVAGAATFLIFVINLIMLNSSIQIARTTSGFPAIGLNVARKLATRCLAHSAGSPQANLLDYEKLKEFEGKHEPCVYSFDYGWQAEIKVMNYDKWGDFEVIKFGARDLSVEDSIIQDRITKQSIPVTVVYPNNYRYLTTLDITVVSGDLELLAGKIDALCIANDTQDLILKFDYETEIKNKEKQVCIKVEIEEVAGGFSETKIKELCRDLRVEDYEYCGSNEIRIYDIFTSEWKASYTFPAESYVISVRYDSTIDQVQIKPWLPI